MTGALVTSTLAEAVAPGPGLEGVAATGPAAARGQATAEAGRQLGHLSGMALGHVASWPSKHCSGDPETPMFSVAPEGWALDLTGGHSSVQCHCHLGTGLNLWHSDWVPRTQQWPLLSEQDCPGHKSDLF